MLLLKKANNEKESVEKMVPYDNTSSRSNSIEAASWATSRVSGGGARYVDVS
jgi:hypothetical protein